jgi:mRNA interferase MazF
LLKKSPSKNEFSKGSLYNSLKVYRQTDYLSSFVNLKISEGGYFYMEIKRGDILLVMLNPSIGSEQGGKRPVVVLQNDVGNKYSPTIIVAPVTSKQNKAKLPTHVEIEDYQSCGLDKPSIILLEQIETIDKSRIIKKLNCVNKNTIKKINAAIKVSIDCNE